MSKPIVLKFLIICLFLSQKTLAQESISLSLEDLINKNWQIKRFVMVNNIEDNTIYTFSEILHPSSQSFKILTRQKIGEKKKELLRWDYNNGFLIIEEGEGFSVKRKYQFLEKGKTIRFFACETAPTKCKRKGEDETMTLLKL